MATKPGRNDPCPCGSGRKYKRCCLPAEEAAALEAARERESWAETPLDDEGFEEGDYLDDFGPALDTKAITRVCYTRGVVARLSDFRRGAGVRVDEWEVPHIPRAVLDEIDEARLSALEGRWGDPTAVEPIQVDVIDLQTDDEVVSIELFNRRLALELADEGDGEIERIHGVCEALEAAAAGGRHDMSGEGAAADEAGPAAAGRLEARAEERRQWASLLKRQRGQPGVCALCAEAIRRSEAQRHLTGCAPAHDASIGAMERLAHLRVTAPGLPGYWLHVEASIKVKLEALDAFLRDIWVECCGHLSSFTIGDVGYFSQGYDLGVPSPDPVRSKSQQRHMDVRIRDVLPSVGDRFGYEYDFGSTTFLQLKVMGERSGRVGAAGVRLLARNTPPEWPCAVCGQPATQLCTRCRDDRRSPFLCDQHLKHRPCSDEELMPVVNSPRIGLCGYVAVT